MKAPKKTGKKINPYYQSCDHTEECLAQRDNYEAIFNSMIEGIFIVNSESVIIKCNRAFSEITGLREDKVIGLKVADLFCENPSCGLNQAIIKTIKTAKSCHEEEMYITRRDGTKTPAVFSTSILKNKQGKETGIVVIFRDVSQIAELKKLLKERYQFHQLIGKNERMQEMYNLIEDVATTGANVIIQGKSGTGKELVASAIHYQSNRSNEPFVKVSCAALSETLLESELFGHVKGAFTGAYKDKKGRFESANKGTLFLDEIGEIGPTVQVKLLRVLQEKEIEMVGDTHPRKVDVRIIAATNKDLKTLVKEKIFREDLYYRLKVITIEIPPLRDRKEDIPLLVEYFINKYNSQYKKKIISLSPKALDILMEYDWDGNVRELENAIEHAFVKARTRTLLPNDFPHEIRQESTESREPFATSENSSKDYNDLIHALEKSGWNQTKTARELGVNRVTVWRNIKKYKIVIPSK